LIGPETPGPDVALLRSAGGGLTPATFRDVDSSPGVTSALAIGRPGRTARSVAPSDRRCSARIPHTGTRASSDRYVEFRSADPRGFAGGPLIDADGAPWIRRKNSGRCWRGEVHGPSRTGRCAAWSDELKAHGGVAKGLFSASVAYARGLGTSSSLSSHVAAIRGCAGSRSIEETVRPDAVCGP